jgi:hypothetical protein
MHPKARVLITVGWKALLVTKTSLLGPFLGYEWAQKARVIVTLGWKSLLVTNTLAYWDYF